MHKLWLLAERPNFPFVYSFHLQFAEEPKNRRIDSSIFYVSTRNIRSRCSCVFIEYELVRVSGMFCLWFTNNRHEWTNTSNDDGDDYWSIVIITYSFECRRFIHAFMIDCYYIVWQYRLSIYVVIDGTHFNSIDRRQRNITINNSMKSISVWNQKHTLQARLRTGIEWHARRKKHTLFPFHSMNFAIFRKVKKIIKYFSAKRDRTKNDFNGFIITWKDKKIKAVWKRYATAT